MALAKPIEDEYRYHSVSSANPALTRDDVKEVGVSVQGVQVNYWAQIYISIAVVAVMSVLLILSSMGVSTRNRAVQDIQTSTMMIEKENTVLHQSVQELSQYDRVMKIANQKRLKMNEENVRNVVNEK